MQTQWGALPAININSLAHERALATVLPKQFNRAKDEVLRVWPRGVGGMEDPDDERPAKVSMVAWTRDASVLVCALRGGTVVLLNTVSGSKSTLFQPPKPEKEGAEDPFVDDGNIISIANVEAIKPQLLMVSIVARKLVYYSLDPLRPSTFEPVLNRSPTLGGVTVVSEIGVPIGDCSACLSTSAQFLIVHVHSREGSRWGVVQRRGATALTLVHSWQTEGSKRITDVAWARNGVAAISTDRGEVLLVDVVTMTHMARISVGILPISRLVAFPLTGSEVVIAVAAENFIQSIIVEISTPKRTRDGNVKTEVDEAVSTTCAAQPLASWSASEFLIQDMSLVVCGGKEGGAHALYVLLENGVVAVLHAASLQRVHGEEVRLVSDRTMLAVREGATNTVAIVDNEHVVVLGR